MAVLSMRARKRISDVGLTLLLCYSALILQLAVLNRFAYNDVICNLPLTLVIVWGAVFGSPLPSITADELRVRSVGQVFIRQAASGSVSGLLVGALFASLLSSVLPVYPVTYPIVGWVAGYFCLRHLHRQNLLCVPLVLVLTGFSELITAAQLFALQRPDVFPHLMQIVFPEAVLNAVMAPFIYLPLRSWYDYALSQALPAGD